MAKKSSRQTPPICCGDTGEVFSSYKHYLKSKHWKNLRCKIIEYRQVCENCGKDNPLEVHHKHYVSVGNERPDDLVVLCAQCHLREHKVKLFGRKQCKHIKAKRIRSNQKASSIWLSKGTRLYDVIIDLMQFVLTDTTASNKARKVFKKKLNGIKGHSFHGAYFDPWYSTFFPSVGGQRAQDCVDMGKALKRLESPEHDRRMERFG